MTPAKARFEAFAAEFGDQYPAVIRLWGQTRRTPHSRLSLDSSGRRSARCRVTARKQVRTTADIRHR
ncbi:hypothetical protein B5D80_28255 [Micromonospora wenchangensis]|uniref:Uncharacterized protein n=1 Tax=Micromonospora wenchangensis TaxID=1185415 RepID=A0A246REM9_9ACTN|nr:hypothetical protein B5D80_28255 [Micromonospora wenchangensis]